MLAIKKVDIAAINKIDVNVCVNDGSKASISGDIGDTISLSVNSPEDQSKNEVIGIHCKNVVIPDDKFAPNINNIDKLNME
ncbi:hypothetical protein [Clostridioides sp. ZZV15-6388]|uniref:hypothetical protein n=1 Tax=unclassified Clostridioides TaxID=2635829 RepID=UPI001D123B98|nr:hypothetical protein [Clostridioides sp. ZZV15-6597]